jgi:3-hydroxybutyryl-CoA dehydratase
MEQIRQFAQLSRDCNPVHLDAPYAELRNFRAPISHGLLTASLLTEIGGQIGWLASGMNLRFKGPVYADEVITCHWTITEIDARGRARAEIQITNPDGTVVLEAETTGVLPGEEERARLAEMVAEGDPTNGARS